ncbi:hypothetical protein D9758_010186 [Tetrapyrgos nigripes]|uniref:Uncharacterized protein n=1 Tax=Tetrapyrgos nigripes TaxID=182062 RepID=A0A8H5CXE3_9AGAR|nr:hypothetical protein D9758_010186 [Tetrapyrgos nigripes]
MRLSTGSTPEIGAGTLANIATIDTVVEESFPLFPSNPTIFGTFIVVFSVSWLVFCRQYPCLTVGALEKLVRQNEELFKELKEVYQGHPDATKLMERLLRDIIYDTTDNHLWREIYLTTFDDPRPLSDRLHTPLVGRTVVETDSDLFVFDWKARYQERVQSWRLLRKGIFAENGSHFDPDFLQSSFDAVISAIDTASIQISSVSEEVSLKEFLESVSSKNTSSPISLNIAWITECLSTGFPPTLVHKLIEETPIKGEAPRLSLYKQLILQPNWDYSNAGKAFHKLVFHTGFRALDPFISDESSSLHSLHPASEFRNLLENTEGTLTVEKQRSLARAAARRRVYHLPYLSADRCWGPFLLLRTESEDTSSCSNGKRGPGHNRPLPALDIEEFLAGEDLEDVFGPENSTDFVREILDDFRLFFQELEGSIARQTLEEAGDEEDTSQHGTLLRSTSSSLASGSGSTSQDTDPYAEAHADPLNITDDDEYTSLNSDTDTDSQTSPIHTHSETPLPGFLHPLKTSSYPMYPDYPHLLQPDYVFLSAARTIVHLNLLERFHTNAEEPVWPWFTNEDAVHALRVLLDNLNGLEGLDGLRMGSAPGFWDGVNGQERRRGWGLVDENESGGEKGADDQSSNADKDEKATWYEEIGIDLEAERKWAKTKNPELQLSDDGWDWAGAQGKWIRAACWMDYRDLLFLNLRASKPQTQSPNTAEDIQETCIVFPMDIAVIGYSRVQAPPALPAATSSNTSPSQNEEKGKGKAKADDLVDNDTDTPVPGNTSTTQQPYNPLVYTLPIIHITGKYSGSQHVIRVARGTVRMIGDGAVRWSLIDISGQVTSDHDPGREEWVTEAVQLGGIGSALGIAGMWTGAMHEKGDPLGPTWAWKIA